MSAVPLLTLTLTGEADVLAARIRARDVAELMAFEPQDRTRIAAVVAVIARNAVTYGSGGQIEFASVAAPARALRVVVRDAGHGIAGLDQILEDDATGGTGLGIGIAGARRLMDEFTIESGSGGTVVTFAKHLSPKAPPLLPALIGQKLATLPAATLADEIRQQDRELMESLATLALKQEESERLNEELAATNRGVVALYAELDEKAAELAGLNAGLEDRVAAAVADYQMVNDALRQSQKMEAVGQLTGGIAHDFNNLLQIVLGNLELVLRRLPTEQARLRRAVDNAIAGAQRAATLTQRLLAFSRRQPLEPKPTDVNRLVEGMSDLMRRTLGEIVTIETRLADGLWIVEIDANQLENALLNLAVNARDAMQAGGTLTITTGNVTVALGATGSITVAPGSAEATADEDAKPGDYVALTVTDTGTGMPPDVMARVFEPFFTTKEVGKGTGLGLSMVYGFVRQSGGHLRLRSTVGHGTAVTLHLPRFDGPLAHAKVAPAEKTEPARLEETILVVEDDAAVRSYSCDVLTELGYDVLVAPDGQSAIEVLDGDRRIDLVFTDLVLSGPLNGHDVAEHAARVRPHTPVLFTSGYAHEVIASVRADETIDLVAKPFSTAVLADRVRQALGASVSAGRS